MQGELVRPGHPIAASTVWQILHDAGIGPAPRSAGPTWKHAYDLETAPLAGHLPRDAPRVGFPSCQRGWNSQPQTARCSDCDTMVQRIVRDLIRAAVSTITSQAPGPAQNPQDWKH